MKTPTSEKLALIIGLLTLSLLSACASGPVAQVEDRPIDVTQSNQTDEFLEENQDTATPLDDQRFNVERAEHFDRLSTAGTAQSATNAALSAAEFYIQASNTDNALQSVKKLNTAEFDEVQRYRYEVILAYAEHARGEYRVALNRLLTQLDRPSAQGQLTRQNQVDALLLSSFCYQSLGDLDNAVGRLIERESLLYSAARAETSRYIWQVINSLSLGQRQQVIATTSNATVRNRFEQSLSGEVGNISGAPNQFDQWRQSAPAGVGTILEAEWSAQSPRVVAVLLPISSRFSKAAQAVQDGLEYQQSLNNSNFRPRLDYYDIGTNANEVGQFYNAAIQNGADVVLGPLGKDYANQLTAYSQMTQSVPTVLLGGDQPLNQRFSRFSLGPEREGQLIAERALAEGYVNAAILIPNDNSGARTAAAFSEHWLNHGGKLNKSITYSPKQFDHSIELKQLFDINKSEARHSRLSKVLGFKPKFAAHRNADIDFVFMIADNLSGRILRPQINFFSGNKMPVIAPSSLYNGIQDATNNVDLDKTSFPVMPWVLLSNDVAPYAGQLNQLFALATDAYRLAANLGRLQSDSTLALQGNTGVVSIASSGEVTYQPLWASFKDGEVLSEKPLSQQQIIAPNGLNRNSKTGNRYDESNWNSRQSRRKTGS